MAKNKYDICPFLDLHKMCLSYTLKPTTTLKAKNFIAQLLTFFFSQENALGSVVEISSVNAE